MVFVSQLCLDSDQRDMLYQNGNRSLTRFRPLVEVFGFLFRTIDIHVGKQPSYILQLLLILLAPALYAASIYMILKRLTRVVDAESYALIPARWLTVFFVGGDVVSFLLQAAGKSQSDSRLATLSYHEKRNDRHGIKH